MRDKQISRKAVFSLVGLIGLLALIFGGGGHLGLFSKVHLEVIERGPYTIVGLSYKGPYRKIVHRLKTVNAELEASGLANTVKMQCAILYDAPKDVDPKSQQSLVGFIVKNDDLVGEPAKYTIERIGMRKVVVAKIEAHPSVALFRSYPKIKRWAKKNNYDFSVPMLEIYHRNGLVELEVPITR